MRNDEYNGWTNYETWSYKLWLDNEENSYKYWIAQARELTERELADALKADAEETATLLQETQDAISLQGYTLGYFKDAMWSSLAQVNWQEISKAYQEAVK
jgi:hypothetical protein